MTAPNQRPSVENTLQDHIKRIRILEAVLASGCDCAGGHCLPSIWTSDCVTGEVTGTTNDPTGFQTVLTLYSLSPTTDGVFHTGLLVDQSADDNGGISGVRVTQVQGESAIGVGVDSDSYALAYSDVVAGDFRAEVAGVGGEVYGVRSQAYSQSAIEADVGFVYGVYTTAELTAGGYGLAVGVSGIATAGGQDRAAGALIFVYGAGLEVGLVANYCIDVTIGDQAVESLDFPEGSFGNPADSTVRMYAYDNAGTLEFRVNLNGTVTTLATE